MGEAAAIEAGDPARESDLPDMSIICLMDMGNGAAKLSKLGHVPRLRARSKE